MSNLLRLAKNLRAVERGIIVFEGIDGSGKQTQMEKFAKRLKQEGHPIWTTDFPRYKTNFGGMALDMILHGELDIDPSDIPIKVLSLFYAIDRAQEAPKIRRALDAGNWVLLDRYWTSNLGCQAGKFKTIQEKEEYVKWLESVEIKRYGLPRESMVILFDISFENAVKLIEKRKQQNDKVEINENYLKTALKTYRWLASKFSHWIRVPCEDEEGNLRSIEDIHEDVVNIFQRKK